MRSLCVEDDNFSLLQDNFRPPCMQGDRLVKRSSMKITSVKNLFENYEVGSTSSTLFSYEKLSLLGGFILVLSIPVIIYMKKN